MGRAVKNSLEIFIKQMLLEGGVKRGGRIRVAVFEAGFCVYFLLEHAVLFLLCSLNITVMQFYLTQSAWCNIRQIVDEVFADEDGSCDSVLHQIQGKHFQIRGECSIHALGDNLL